MGDIDRNKIRREVYSAFTINAFTPKKDVLDYCVEAVCKFDKEKRKKWLNKIIETLRKQSLNNSVVSQDIIREVFTQISSRGSRENSSFFNIFDAFSIRKFVFDPEFKKMLSVTEPPRLNANVDKATTALRHRFQLVAQRAHRCKQLEAFKFSTIEALLGSSKKQEGIVVLAMLTQQEADCYHMEDLTGSMRIEFTNDTKFYSFMFTEGSIIIFEGLYDASLFTVAGMTAVPAETADETRVAFGNVNWFGGDDMVAFRCNEKLCIAERNNPDASIVFLSDVHLDSPKVLQALYHLFSGFSVSPPVPIAFIFCGNFCSRSRQPETMQLLEDGFRRLANSLNEFKSSFPFTHFVFVPGPDDPSLNMMLPRPHLPSNLFKSLETIPNCTFVTNPVHIQYASQEIVVLRDDLVEKMSRHSVNGITPDMIPKCFTRSILSQAHLSPLPPHVAPVLWDWDHVLSLHPLPDVLIVADKFEHFVQTHVDTIVSNPGSFSLSSFGFHVYYPSRHEMEYSGVDLPS